MIVKNRLNLSDSRTRLSSLLNPTEKWLKRIFFLTVGLSVHYIHSLAETSGHCVADLPPNLFSSGKHPRGLISNPKRRQMELPESSKSADGGMWEHWAENSSAQESGIPSSCSLPEGARQIREAGLALARLGDASPPSGGVCAGCPSPCHL